MTTGVYVSHSGASLAGTGTWDSGRPQCGRCSRFLARASDMCSCGWQHVIAADGAMGVTDADRLQADVDAGYVPHDSAHWDAELARIDRQQRAWEERNELGEWETTVSYDPSMVDAVPSSLAARREVQRLEAQLAEARGAFVQAMRSDREAGWSTKRLSDHLGISAQAIGQQTPGVKRLPAGRPKAS